MNFYKTKDLLSIFQDDDSISGDGYMQFSSQHLDLHYIKRDFIYRSGIWRDNRIDSFIRNRPRSKTILISGHSDIHTKFLDLLLLKALGIRFVFSTNCSQLRGVSQCLPIGLTNSYNDSTDHLVLGNTGPFIEILSNPIMPETFANSVLMAFNTHTAQKHREKVFQLFQTNKDTNFVSFDISADGRLQYLRAIYSNDFVLCPRGNGRDTHRLWESLYLGSIPIVKSGDLPRKLLEKFPVWIVSNWAEALDPDRRATVRSDILSRDWDVRWLRQSFWNSMISSKINS